MGASDSYPEDADDDPYDEAESRQPASAAPSGWIPRWSGWGTSVEEEADGTTGEVVGTAGEGPSWLDEGLVTLLLVAGVVLFVIPEPATSTLGIVLILVGAFAWLVDWLGGPR